MNQKSLQEPLMTLKEVTSASMQKARTSFRKEMGWDLLGEGQGTRWTQSVPLYSRVWGDKARCWHVISDFPRERCQWPFWIWWPPQLLPATWWAPVPLLRADCLVLPIPRLPQVPFCTSPMLSPLPAPMSPRSVSSHWCKIMYLWLITT